MTTTQPTEETTMRVPPSPDAPTPTDRTPEPVRVVYLPEVITDRAAIRDSDEADELTPEERLLRAIFSNDHEHPAADLDIDALHETICDNFTSMAEVRQAADALVDALARVTREAEALRAQVAAVEARVAAGTLLDCGCGHSLDEHNGLGCYARITYTPLVTCECALTDDRTHEDLLRANYAALATTGEGE